MTDMSLYTKSYKTNLNITKGENDTLIFHINIFRFKYVIELKVLKNQNLKECIKLTNLIKNHPK